MGKHYDLYELIGGGGFADVYRAVLRGTRRQFALKLLRDFRNLDARHRFVREVRMLRGLKHERVIKLIDANTNAEQPFYVMPLMSGGAMTAWAGRLPFANARVVLAQVLDFLAYLHAQGGLHRDIKPDNFLVDASGNFAVGDFGLGNNPRYTVLMTAHAAGTWGYVAPVLQHAECEGDTRGRHLLARSDDVPPCYRASSEGCGDARSGVGAARHPARYPLVDSGNGSC